MSYNAKLDFELSRVSSGRPKSYANQEMFQFYKFIFDFTEII